MEPCMRSLVCVRTCFQEKRVVDRRRGQIRSIRFVSYYAYLTSAMTHIQVRGDLICTLFKWSSHSLVSSIVTRIVLIGVGLLRIGTCKLAFSGGKIQLLMTVTSSTIGLMWKGMHPWNFEEFIGHSVVECLRTSYGQKRRSWCEGRIDGAERMVALEEAKDSGQ